MTFTRCATVAAVVAAFLGYIVPTAGAAPGAKYGIHDDAWLLHGPGTLSSRLAELDRVGVDIVRFTLRWDDIAAYVRDDWCPGGRRTDEHNADATAFLQKLSPVVRAAE